MKTLVKFGVVGALCFFIQFLLLQLLKTSIAPYAANWIGFILSAQVNFVLSYSWTWNHSERKSGVNLWFTWAKFMVFVVIASIANVFAFTIATSLWHWFDLFAVLMAVIVSTGVSLIFQRFVVFRPVPTSLDELIRLDTIPASLILEEPESVEERIVKPGVAFFMPAYNEAENLRYTIAESIAYLSEHSERFCVIVVDDGSTDNTREVVEQMMLAFPGHVQLVTHSPNKGYGAAIRTGLLACLEMDYEWIGFCDSDRQFKPRDVGKFISRAERHGADIAIGFRKKRADNLKRRLMGRGWHMLSRLVLGYVARDVDCGFKVFRHRALADIAPKLRGDHAVISPEILARAHFAGHAIVEVPVSHYARESGTQTGANVRVVLQSLKGLLEIRHAIRLDARLGSTLGSSLTR